ncbi:E3 ubiquitin-protein ligase RFWD3-like isoform X2 [Scaptodrosophila lebanonensis]|nr:E3 ubiquitin-protein ligase RFWD3-like isoform X2 [Scaptodrosophila lebanonensis]
MGAKNSVEQPQQLEEAVRECEDLKTALGSLEKEHAEVVGQLELQRLELRRLEQQSQRSNENVVSVYDESVMCSICYEPWAISGNHQLVSLCCGHLFGDHCVRKALEKCKYCPQCRRRAAMRDIRPIHAHRVCAIDNSENQSRVGKRTLCSSIEPENSSSDESFKKPRLQDD